MLRRRSRTITDEPPADEPRADLDLVRSPPVAAGLQDLDDGLDLTSVVGPSAGAGLNLRYAEDYGDDDDVDADEPAHLAAGRRPPLRAAPAAPARQDGLSTEIQAVVSETVSRVLSNAFVARIDQQTAQIDGMARQLQALTTAVDELTESTRALLRHQWDNMPPQNFWARMQRADDEVRRSVDELAAEVRGRIPRPRRS
jgi:pimeloyl-ACP methyl ester carboxylesterase